MTTPHFTSVWSDFNQVEFSQGFLQAGPYRTRYLHSGDDSKPLLLMMHGITGHAEAYSRNLASHGEHFNVYAIDFIGHGYSSKPEHPLEIKHYIDQLSALLETLEADRVHLAGESLGGWVAAKFAAQFPEKVDKLTLNTMAGTRADPKVMERLLTLSMQAADDPSWERVRTRLEWLMADPSMVTDDLIKTRQMIFEQAEWKMACTMNMALQDPETRARNMVTDTELKSIKSEALVIWTTKDPSGPVAEGERIADLIPKGQLAVIDNAGHWPQYEKTEEFNKIHLDFLLGRS